MCSDIAIKAENLTKVYTLYRQPVDRLKQFFWGRYKQYYKGFTALENISFELPRGEVLGIVGRNGSGKSTLLQLICGTLQPTSGHLQVNGRIAALLELGAGFNPEFTGRENIYMNAAILGLTREQIDARYDDIVAFSGVGNHIEQPVKTYSSGMYVRLAFSVAINVDPEILIIDEALSVGDGAFSRKSFERIMQLKEQGKTILFCSHSMYQLEVLCSRAIWLDQGRLMASGTPAEIVVAYNEFLESMSEAQEQPASFVDKTQGVNKQARFVKIEYRVNGQTGPLKLVSGRSTLSIDVIYWSDPQNPAPSFGVAIFATADDRLIASCTSIMDNFSLPVAADGHGHIKLDFTQLPLLKGNYYLNLYLACDKGLHVYEEILQAASFQVVQTNVEQGVVSLPHLWHQVD